MVVRLKDPPFILEPDEFLVSCGSEPLETYLWFGHTSEAGFQPRENCKNESLSKEDEGGLTQVE
jgi:hypothetical protein